MKRTLKPDKELIAVRSEITRIDKHYAANWLELDNPFIVYMHKRRKELKEQELQILKKLGYVRM